MTKRAASNSITSFASSNGYEVFKDAIVVTEEDVTRLHRLTCDLGARIFNPDDKRVQASIQPDDPVYCKLMAFFHIHGLLIGRAIGDAVAITSHAGCRRQQFHFDYDNSCVAIARVKPLGVLCALQNDTRLELPHKTLFLNAGDVLCFDGDLKHAGAAYDKLNTRVHMYLDSPEVRRQHNKTYLT